MAAGDEMDVCQKQGGSLVVWGRGGGGLCLERAFSGSVRDRSEGKEAGKKVLKRQCWS